MYATKDTVDMHLEALAGSQFAVRRSNTVLNVRRVFYVGIIMLFVMAATIAIQNQIIVQSEYELWALKRQYTNEMKATDQSKLDLARLKSPERIQQLAASRIGMIVPAKVYLSGVKSGVEKNASDGRVADAGTASIKND